VKPISKYGLVLSVAALIVFWDLLQIRPDDVKDLPYSEWN